MGPRISLIIPAWNEAEFLPHLLESVQVAREQFHAGEDAVEVIVADNGSTDETAAIARAHGCVVVPVEKRCIAAARNGGADVARGEFVAFSDADFRLHPETFNSIDALMQRGEHVGGGTGLTMERWSLGIRVAWTMLVPLLRFARIEGGVWFCRREDFQMVGGYDEELQAAEDVKFLLALKSLGRRRRPRQRLATARSFRRCGIRVATVVNSARKFDVYGEWHFVSLMLKAPFLCLFTRRRADAYIQRYFYEGRGASARGSSVEAEEEPAQDPTESAAETNVDAVEGIAGVSPALRKTIAGKSRPVDVP